MMLGFSERQENKKGRMKTIMENLFMNQIKGIKQK